MFECRKHGRSTSKCCNGANIPARRTVVLQRATKRELADRLLKEKGVYRGVRFDASFEASYNLMAKNNMTSYTYLQLMFYSYYDDRDFCAQPRV